MTNQLSVKKKHAAGLCNVSTGRRATYEWDTPKVSNATEFMTYIDKSHITTYRPLSTEINDEHNSKLKSIASKGQEIYITTILSMTTAGFYDLLANFCRSFPFDRYSVHLRKLARQSKPFAFRSICKKSVCGYVTELAD